MSSSQKQTLLPSPQEISMTYHTRIREKDDEDNNHHENENDNNINHTNNKNNNTNSTSAVSHQQDTTIENDDGEPAVPTASCFILLTSALGGVLFGLDTAIVSGANFQMSKSFHFELNSWENGLIVAIGVAGAFIGSIIAGWSGDRFGRKKTIIAADVFFIIGSLVLAFAPDYWTVLCGRVVIGLGIGLSSVMTPVFLAEITTAENRGPAITLNNVCLTGAQFLAALIAIAFVATENESNPDPIGWRFMFGICLFPALIQIILFNWIPESPRWQILVKKPRDEIEDSVRRLGLDANFIQEQQDELDKTPQRTVSELVADINLRKRILIGSGLQFFQQFNGINICMYFASEILANAGFQGDKDPVYFSAPLAFINAAFTLVSFYLVERKGRRPLLLFSTGGCLIATLLFSAVGFASDEPYPKTSAILFICCLAVFLANFSFGWGALPWVLNSEIYPTDCRIAAAAFATCVNWASNTVVSQSFPIVLGKIGLPWTFIIVAVFIVLSGFFAYFFVPETKGLSLEEIEKLLSSGEDGVGHQRVQQEDDDRRAIM